MASLKVGRGFTASDDIPMNLQTQIRVLLPFRLRTWTFFGAAVLLLTGCASVRPESKTMLQEAREYGLSVDKVEEVSPGVAGALNVLPGFGNVYLAFNSDEKTVNWVLFPVNLLTWPFSILWGIPQAAVDANTINMQATADYYMYDKDGKAEFEKAKAKSDGK